MSRGAGKGALIHLFQQPVESTGGSLRRVQDYLFQQPVKSKGGSLRRVQDYLFPHPDPDFCYHGSFLVHLSFSMEFASVINALAYFVLDALVGLLVDNDSRTAAFSALAKQANKDAWKDDPVLRHIVDPQSGSPLWGALRDLERIKAKLSGPIDERNRAKDRRKAAKTLVRELRQAVEFGHPPSDSNARSHRVEMCRMALTAFRKLSHAVNNDDRLFICFTGLDKLCDAKGRAYNPMYRALFRLLTGEGTKFDDESDPSAPLDIVLIAGDPRKNVLYINEQRDRAAIEQEMGNTPFHVKYQPIEGSDLYHRNWEEIEGVPLKDRFWLKNASNSAVREFHNQLSNVTPPDDKGLCPEATIRQFLSSGVALSSWCAGAWAAEESEQPDGEPLSKRTTDFLKRLDAAADREGLHGVLRQVLGAHHRSLQIQWQRERSEMKAAADPNSSDGKEYKKRLDRWPNAKAQLFDLILKHLTIFPLPVELRVLYSCDEIHFLLHQIYDPFEKPKNRREFRKLCLEKLHALLDEMWRRHILIRVTPKQGGYEKRESWQKKQLPLHNTPPIA
jgi:hypothetical protein